MSRGTRLFVTATTLAIAICAIVAASSRLAWLDLLYYLSYLKLVISFIKFIPQVWVRFLQVIKAEVRLS